jgi:RND family efflux transporter MFP subunit
VIRALRPLLGVLLLGLAACSQSRPEAAAPALPALATIPVGVGGAPAGRAWDGVVEAVRQADLSAQTSGRVLEVGVDIDDRVSAGQVLLRLSAVEQEAGADTARAQLRAAEAAAAEAQATYSRFLALGAKQFVSRLQLDQVRASRDAAVAARDAARAQLAQSRQQADYTVVRAPFAGVVSARRVEPGESVVPGQPLLSIHAPGALRLVVQLPQSDVAAIRAAANPRILLADGRILAAGAVTISPSADASTHTVAVRVALPDTDAAPQPGATAKLLFPIAGAAARLEIPRVALARRGEITGVYVLDGTRLSLRQLRLGETRGDQVEVLAGLKSGEVIVADPVAAVQALAAQRRTAVASE